MIENLDDVEIAGLDVAGVMDSCKLHGPPGTGKTTNSGARVGTAVRDHGVNIGDVAWATYRKSLAEDTLQRFVTWGLLDPEELDEPGDGRTKWIGTLHALGHRCCPDLPDPADDQDRADFCEKRDIRYWPAGPYQEPVGQMLFDMFSWLRENRLDPADPADARKWPGYDDLRDAWPHGDYGKVWKEWDAYKDSRDLIDFYEQLEIPLEAGYVPDCEYLVLDEYHDVTPLRAALAEMWIDAVDTVVVAGDPHQVVNSFDGADPRFFERIDLPEVLLDKTWRVPEEHWRVAATMLNAAHDPPPVDRLKRGSIEVWNSPDFNSDTDSGTWDVPGPNAKGGPVHMAESADESVLFLTRTRIQATGVTRALDKAGIMYDAQPRVSDAWSAQSVRTVLHNALQKIRPLEPSAFGSGGGLAAYRTNGDGPAPQDVELSSDNAAALLDQTPAEFLQDTRDRVDEYTLDLRNSAASVTAKELNTYVTTEFWDAFTAGPGSVDRLLRSGMDDRDRTALRNALRRYDDAVEPGERRVNVLTIHAAKGWDAHTTVLYDGTSPRAWDEMRRSERSARNEYRTWYVGLTRAKKKLHIMRDAFDWTVSIIPDDADLQRIADPDAHSAQQRAGGD